MSSPAVVLRTLNGEPLATTTPVAGVGFQLNPPRKGKPSSARGTSALTSALPSTAAEAHSPTAAEDDEDQHNISKILSDEGLIMKRFLSTAIPLTLTQYNFCLLPVLSLVFAGLFADSYFTQEQVEAGATAVMLTCVGVGSSLYLLNGYVFVSGVCTATDVLISRVSGADSSPSSSADAHEQGERPPAAESSSTPNSSFGSRQLATLKSVTPVVFNTLISSIISAVFLSVATIVFWITCASQIIESTFIHAIHGGVYAAVCFAPLILVGHCLLPSLTKFFQYAHSIEATSYTHSPRATAAGSVTEESWNSHSFIDKLRWIFRHRILTLPPVALAAMLSLASAPFWFVVCLLLLRPSVLFIDARAIVLKVFGFDGADPTVKITMQLVAAVMIAQSIVAATETAVLLYFALHRGLPGNLLRGLIALPAAKVNPVRLLRTESAQFESAAESEPAPAMVPHSYSCREFLRYWKWSDLRTFWRVGIVTLLAYLAEAWVVESYMLLSPAMHCDPVLGGAFVIAMNLAFAFFPVIVGVANASATLMALIPSGPEAAGRARLVLKVIVKVWAVMVSVATLFILVLGPKIIDLCISSSHPSGGPANPRAVDYADQCLPVVALFHFADSLQYILQCVFRGLGWTTPLLVINAMQWVVGVPLSLFLLAAACPASPFTLGIQWLPALAQAPVIGKLFVLHHETGRVDLNPIFFAGGPDVAILGYIWPLLLVEVPLFTALLLKRLGFGPVVKEWWFGTANPKTQFHRHAMSLEEDKVGEATELVPVQSPFNTPAVRYGTLS
jgi:Na+-driven multidrug efflux pump